MKGWAELKEAFWAAVDGDPAERARHVAALGSIDPALPARLEALLAADDRCESLQHLFLSEPAGVERPSRIGVYDVVGVLGVGGMGEVYRARDVRLQREVAIKVLPAAVTRDPNRWRGSNARHRSLHRSIIRTSRRCTASTNPATCQRSSWSSCRDRRSRR